MYQMDFTKRAHVHFIGIGGVSMSGLAVILTDNGFKVSGSDSRLSSTTDKLAAAGMIIYEGNNASNLDDRPDVIIYTAAVHADNPEFIRAQQLNIPMLTRAQLLGQIMKNYKTAIGVSGTHGKTTTTSMLSHILINSGINPTITVGGNLGKIGGNIYVSQGDTFLTEACEYTNSFLSLFPTLEVILNIEADHLDFFKDIDDIRASFKAYMELLPEDGTLVINNSIRDLSALTKDMTCPNIITYGPGGDYTSTDETVTSLGCYSFKINAPGRPCDGRTVSLNVPGTHNISNALAAIAAADALGVLPDDIISSVEEFTGTDRRFQKKGELCGITIIDDYAHHPQEIEATLNAATNYPHERLRVIFQPHTYTRTKLLFDDFAKALSMADEVIVAKIYAARETDTLGMSAHLLSEAIKKEGTASVSFEDFEEIEDYILTSSAPGDLLITMGAGDVYRIGEALLGKR